MNLTTALLTTLLIGITMHTPNCYAVTSTTTTGDTIRIESEPFLPTEFHNEKVSVFIDGNYRGSEPADFAPMLEGDWYDLYKDPSTDEFVLEKSAITIAKEYDDCLMDSSTFVSSRDAILMLNGINAKGERIKSFIPEVTTIQPGEKLSFTFNNEEYILRAGGTYTDENNTYIIDNFPEEGSHNEVLNYKLYLYNKDKKQLLISVPRFNDTFVQILFIGDLDEDGKPDFIFDTSREYEEKRVTLFLSSPAKNQEIVVATDEASYQFDC